MKKLILFCLFIFLLSSVCFSQTGWYLVPSGTGNSLSSACFVNNQTGWVCGDMGLIKKTTNGGNSWFSQSAPTQYFLWTIFFLNENTGWAGGGHINISTYSTNVIVKTTNGGNNWFLQLRDTTVDYLANSIYFINASTGVAGCFGSSGFGASGCILRTTNGGTNWSTTQCSGNSTKIYFQNNNTGWSLSYEWSDIGRDTGKVYKTTNSGVNWLPVLSKNMWEFKNIYFFNENTGIVQEKYSRYLKTTNGGINWTYFFYDTLVNRSDCFFLNELTGWSCGTPIKKTTNGGYNWINQTPNLNYGLTAITFKDSLNGWAVGYAGKILKTTTGGTIFINQISTIVPDKFSMFQNYPNPFNPCTSIKFQIAKSSFTSLKVFDIQGKETATLVNEKLQTGEYEVKFDGSNLPSGIYFYTFTSGEYKETKKMILLR